jgi:hypothetical protein
MAERGGRTHGAEQGERRAGPRPITLCRDQVLKFLQVITLTPFAIPHKLCNAPEGSSVSFALTFRTFGEGPGTGCREAGERRALQLKHGG